MGRRRVLDDGDRRCLFGLHVDEWRADARGSGLTELITLRANLDSAFHVPSPTPTHSFPPSPRFFLFPLPPFVPMLRSSPATSNDHHARRHLDPHLAHDERFSQFSDTPSVYTPSHFSSPPHNQHYAYSSHTRHRFNEPSVSTIDFDDPRASVATSQNIQGDDEGDDETHSFEEQRDPRLSYLGPKMRFHSRAPWEMEGDTLEEENESVLPASPKHSVFPFSLARTHPNHSQTTLGGRRPSVDSSQSYLSPKRSFDTINSQLSSKGAL